MRLVAVALVLLVASALGGVVDAPSPSCVKPLYADCTIAPGMKTWRKTFCSGGGADESRGEVNGAGCSALRSCCGVVSFESDSSEPSPGVEIKGALVRRETEGGRRVLVVPSGASVQFAFSSLHCVGSILLSGAGAVVKTRSASDAQEHERRVASRDGSYSRIELPSYNCDLASLTVTAGGAKEVRVAEFSACRENSAAGDCSGLCATRCPKEAESAADRGNRAGVVDPLFGIQTIT